MRRAAEALVGRCTSLAFVLCLAACSSIPPADYRSAAPADLPPRVELRDVPFYPQAEYQCGPASLAMVLNHAGAARTPDDVAAQVYLPGRQGSLQAEMLAAVRRAGLLPYVLPGEPGALLRETAAGHPVVVLLNLRFDFLPQWHYAVVIGYDLAADSVLLHSGTDPHATMRLGDFDRAWARSRRWAFVALPPDRLPASAEESRYVQAAADLERVAPRAALLAFTTALQRWPTNLAARIGLGNIAYAGRDLAAAEAHYRQAAMEHPESGDAWNNLAQVLHEQGRDEDALQAADRAMAIGGTRQAVYAATRAEISARQ